MKCPKCGAPISAEAAARALGRRRKPDKAHQRAAAMARWGPPVTVEQVREAMLRRDGDLKAVAEELKCSVRTVRRRLQE